MIESFKNKKLSGKAEFTIVVDDSFQYGQEVKDGTRRWLCYHNKDNKPYQVSKYAANDISPRLPRLILSFL